MQREEERRSPEATAQRSGSAVVLPRTGDPLHSLNCNSSQPPQKHFHRWRTACSSQPGDGRHNPRPASPTFAAVPLPTPGLAAALRTVASSAAAPPGPGLGTGTDPLAAAAPAPAPGAPTPATAPACVTARQAAGHAIAPSKMRRWKLGNVNMSNHVRQFARHLDSGSGFLPFTRPQRVPCPFHRHRLLRPTQPTFCFASAPSSSDRAASCLRIHVDPTSRCCPCPWPCACCPWLPCCPWAGDGAGDARRGRGSLAGELHGRWKGCMDGVKSTDTLDYASHTTANGASLRNPAPTHQAVTSILTCRPQAWTAPPPVRALPPAHPRPTPRLEAGMPQRLPPPPPPPPPRPLVPAAGGRRRRRKLRRAEGGWAGRPWACTTYTGRWVRG